MFHSHSHSKPQPSGGKWARKNLKSVNFKEHVRKGAKSGDNDAFGRMLCENAKTPKILSKRKPPKSNFGFRFGLPKLLKIAPKTL